MKRANGTGSISKLKGNRRKPYAIRISVPIKNTNLKKQKYITYFKTIKEAQQYLKEFTLEENATDKIPTFLECIDCALERESNTLKEDTFYKYNTTYKNMLLPLWEIPINELSGKTYQRFIDNLIKEDVPAKRLITLTSVANKGIRYAIREGYITHDPLAAIDYIGAKRGNTRNRKPFSHEEIETLWKNKENDMVKQILILIYTGMRISEFMSIDLDDYNKKEKYLSIKESKTESGIRIIPIHKSIQPFITYFMKKYEALYDGCSYDAWRERFHSTLSNLNMEHIPHETRHTFITLMNEKRVDITIIKVLCGHRVSDITKGTYTHENYNRLKEGIDKLR